MSVASRYERQMLRLINEERADAGLKPLRLNRDLNDSSEDHSKWMLDTDQFSHTGAGGSSPTARMTAAGYDLEGSWRTGENIAWQSERGAPGIRDDVVQLHESLMNSPGHRANILNPDFKEIGIGIETGDMGRWDAVMVTQNFGRTDARPGGSKAQEVTVAKAATTAPQQVESADEMPSADAGVDRLDFLDWFGNQDQFAFLQTRFVRNAAERSDDAGTPAPAKAAGAAAAPGEAGETLYDGPSAKVEIDSSFWCNLHDQFDL